MRQDPHEMQQPQPPQPPQPQPLPQPLQPLQPLQPRQPPQPRACCSPSRVPAFSLSKTKNVPRLTSEISSSLRVISGTLGVSREDTSAAGATVAADAPPASDNDTPTTPSAGTTSLRRLRFEVGFFSGIQASLAFDNVCAARIIRTLCVGTMQDRPPTRTQLCRIEFRDCMKAMVAGNSCQNIHVIICVPDNLLSHGAMSDCWSALQPPSLRRTTRIGRSCIEPDGSRRRLGSDVGTGTSLQTRAGTKRN
jgi:hypothetical protein